MNKLEQAMYTQKQYSVIQDIKEKNPRHVIFEGAVRSGKTDLGIKYWLAILSRVKGKLFIMTGQTISSLKRNVLDDIEKMTGHSTHLNMNNEFEINGNKVACFGSDKSDSYKSMRGLTASGWYANEVILSHQNTILEAFARCSDGGAKIVWETNPDKPTHYIKTNYIDKSGDKLSDGSYNILNYHFILEDNTFLDSNYVESLKLSIPNGTIYERQILGKWKATDKAIYTDFDVVDDEKVYDDYCYGLDFGFNNPSALVKVGYLDNELYISGLMHRSQMTETDLVTQVKMLVDKDKPVYCDNAEPDKIQALQNAGINAYKAKKEVMAGINKVQLYKLHLLRNTELVRSFENYEFRTNANGETLDEPVKYNDHYPDATRYAIYTHGFNNNSNSILESETFDMDFS